MRSESDKAVDLLYCLKSFSSDARKQARPASHDMGIQNGFLVPCSLTSPISLNSTLWVIALAAKISRPPFEIPFV